jgi:virginiamycin B lyase
VGLRRSRRISIATAALGIWVCSSGLTSALADTVNLPPRRSISELTPAATIHVGKTADWVAVTADAVWVGSTGPYAVHRIDPKTNRLTASVALPGEPCAGLATGFGSLWVPMCTAVPSLAKVDLAGNRLTAVFAVGPAAAEGGVATGAGDVWLIVDKVGTLARIDPATGSIRQTVKVPAGSYNPHFSDGQIWVTRADGAELTRVDAASGAVFDTVPTGPNPRFLTAAAGGIWTLNQGNGTLTRVDARTRQATTTVALGTPGHGGDISSGAGMVWTTMPKVPLSAIDAEAKTLRCQWAGPGGDSLGIGHGAIWLTDYHAGTISRIVLSDALAHCSLPSRLPQTPRRPD